MYITKEMIKEANLIDSKTSNNFEKLSFYKGLMEEIDKEYSNDEIESLQWILKELGRNVEYKTMRGRLFTKYEATIELTRDWRRNNIKIDICEINYLLLNDGTHKFVHSTRIMSDDSFRLIPFYKDKLDTIKEIHEEFDKIADTFNIINRIDAIEKIEELTKYKRINLKID